MHEEFDDLTDDAVMDAIAKVLRKQLETPVNYGYDALADRYFFSAPDYQDAYVDFLGRFLRERRWDILQRVVELLEEAVTNNSKKVYEDVKSVDELKIEYVD